METSLHRELKTLYAGKAARVEVPLMGYRIDAVVGKQLVEVQHGSLAAIRSKIARLLKSHDVLVVKPLVARRTLVKLAGPDGPVTERRRSPKRATPLDLFHELVYFTQVFPHRRLTLELPLVEIEEWRYPGHGRRRRWRKSDFVVVDQRLVRVAESHRLQTADDLCELLPALPETFDSAALASACDIPRWVAQRITYCLRKCGAIAEVGKRRNTRIYRRRAAG